MDRLPNELVLQICRRLPFRDCRNLLATCGRFHDLIPAAMQQLSKTMTVIIRDEGDFSRMDLIENYNLFTHIEKLRINVEVFSCDGCDLSSMANLNRLRGVTAVCPNIRVLQLDFTDEKIGHEYYEGGYVNDGERARVIKLINEWLPSLALLEFHCGRNDEFRSEKCLVPTGLVTCSITHQELSTTFLADQSLQTSSLSSIQRLHLVVAEAAFYMAPSMWIILSRMPVLEELSLSGDAFLGLMNEGNAASGVTLGVKQVKLDLRMTHSELRKLLPRFSNVDTIFLDVSRLFEEFAYHDSTGGFKAGWIVLWPKSLRRLHLYGLLPRGRYRWFDSFFEKFKRRNPLVAVTQDFEFQWDNLSSSEDIMPRVTSEFERMVPLYSTFKDFYFWIKSPSDWEAIAKILRSIADVNRLYLYLADAPGVGSLPAASPVISTPIQRVTVNHHSYPCQATRNLIASFAEVGEWSLLSASVDDRQLNNNCLLSDAEEDQQPPFIGRIGVVVKGGDSLEELLRNYQLVSSLTITNASAKPIDLIQLRSLVAANLKTLEVIGSLDYDHKETNLAAINSICCAVDSSQISACFDFPKLERICFREICVGEVKKWLRIFEGMKPFSAWPPQLKEIVVHQRRDGQYIRLADFGLGVDILHAKKSSFDELGFHGTHGM